MCVFVILSLALGMPFSHRPPPITTNPSLSPYTVMLLSLLCGSLKSTISSAPIWEGTFNLIAAILIFVVGLTMLRIDKAKAKWRTKLHKAFISDVANSATQGPTSNWAKWDPNVPGGQRSVIAFLNDPLVGQDALQEAEESFPEMAPKKGDELPWPFVSQPPMTAEIVEELAYKQSFFAPERGIDIPGVMRVAHMGFSLPQWVDCVVHVECKTKFTVASLGAHGIKLRKLEDWTCTA
ncbi:high-affinity iron permease [Tulasnella sp. 425]|nr:high-affinity iron permease [Tulasnella sp. 425]